MCGQRSPCGRARSSHAWKWVVSHKGGVRAALKQFMLPHSPQLGDLAWPPSGSPTWAGGRRDAPARVAAGE